MLKLLVLCCLCLGVKGTWFVKRFDYTRGNGPSKRIFLDAIDSLPMTVDHFSSNSTTFNMRFACNEEFYTGSGPLFLIIGGEASLDQTVAFLTDGSVYDMAKEKKAYMCMTEHRFYGKSIPNSAETYFNTAIKNEFSNVDMSNMRYLTIEQALADLASFIIDRKKKIPGLGKVLAIGGSYAGTLAAWVRLKYPHLVDLAYSSSGVFNLKPNNYEYNEIVQNVLGQNKSCLGTIKNAFSSLSQLAKTEIGAEKITRDFRLHNLDLTDPQGIRSFLIKMSIYFDGLVQYNEPKKRNRVEKMCKILLKNTTQMDDYNRFVKFYLHYFNTTSYSDKKDDSDNSDDNEEERTNLSWMFQICYQIGSFVTTDSPNQPFSDIAPLHTWIKHCRDTFGTNFSFEKLSTNIRDTMITYGGLYPQVTNTVFTVGAADPWSGIALRKGNNETAPLIVIEGASHCNDLFSEHVNEYPTLTEARELAKKYIYSWL